MNPSHDPPSQPTVEAAEPPPYADWIASSVTGKSDDRVWPATVAFPRPSTAMPLATWLSAPPRSVEYTNAVPPLLSFTTKASVPEPFFVVWYAPPVVGKLVESLEPAT